MAQNVIKYRRFVINLSEKKVLLPIFFVNYTQKGIFLGSKDFL